MVDAVSIALTAPIAAAAAACLRLTTATPRTYVVSTAYEYDRSGDRYCNIKVPGAIAGVGAAPW